MGKRLAFAAVCLFSIFFALLGLSCGGGDSTTGPVDAGTAHDASNADTSMTVVPDTGPPPEHSIGGTVRGLAPTSSGVVLQNNGGDTVKVTQDGSFAFPTKLMSGSTFDVTVLMQPTGPSQTCTVAGGAGSVGAVDVTAIVVSCATNTYAIGGTVVGLLGDSLVLQDNGGDDLTLSGQDGGSQTFAFATKVPSGGMFAVTISTQPTTPTQTCSVSGGTGTVVAGDVTSVTVNCATNTYTVGGTITGLSGTVVLEDNGGNDLTINSNGSFAFPMALASGSPYDVTVLTQPSNPTQVCTVSQGTGTVGGANVTTVAVSCATSDYTVTATVMGLAGTGLVLQDNLGDNLAVTGAPTVTFATPIPSGQAYSVTVFTQPLSPSQTCTVLNGSGLVTNANITNVVVDCSTNKYSVGGTVTGLLGGGLVLVDNMADTLPVAAPGGAFTFGTPVLSGQMYTVTIQTQPTNPTQTCTVTNGMGTMGTGDVTSVTVNCVSNAYTIGGTVSGLAGTGLILQDNGGDNLSISGNGNFVFPTSIASGHPYAVSVLVQPSGPTQSCAVTSGGGTVASSNITNVTVICTTTKFTIGGTVNGLTGSGLVLQDNGGDNLPISGNGTFAFPTSIASGQVYAVSVLTEPSNPAQTCTVSNGGGTVGAANVTNVSVNCSTNAYSIGGTVSGLTGSGLVLQDNGADNLSVPANGNFVFPTKVASGGMYAVTILTQPYAHCVVASGGTGTVTNANITNVTILCSLCGNGDLDPGEQCDDGNTINTDACTNACTLGPIVVGGTAQTYITSALTSLGETFTTDTGGTPPGTTWPPSTGVGTIIISDDGFAGTLVDYTAHIAAGAHVIVVGGSSLSAYISSIGNYVTTDPTLTAWTESSCTNQWNKITTSGAQNTITSFLPASYNFINAEVSYHMTEFLGNGSQPAGAVVLGSTCTGANPNILVTRRYASQGTFTYNAFDLGNYNDTGSQAGYVAPFLKGALLYLRSPH